MNEGTRYALESRARELKDYVKYHKRQLEAKRATVNKLAKAVRDTEAELADILATLELGE